jgi:hypothetical protein
MITQSLYTLDYLGQQFGTYVQSGVVEKLCPEMIIHQAHSGKELCHHMTLTTTQLPHQTVFIQLKMMERGMAINPLKTT